MNRKNLRNYRNSVNFKSLMDFKASIVFKTRKKFKTFIQILINSPVFHTQLRLSTYVIHQMSSYIWFHFILAPKKKFISSFCHFVLILWGKRHWGYKNCQNIFLFLKKHPIVYWVGEKFSVVFGFVWVDFIFFYLFFLFWEFKVGIILS